MVNQKHPPQMSVSNRTRHNINEVTTGGRGDRGNQRGGSGHAGRHGGRGNRGTSRTWTDSRMITLTDGSQIEYHASFNFRSHVYLKMKQEDRDTLKRERAAYNERNGRTSRNSEIQELRSQIQELQGSVAGRSTPPTDTVSVSNRSQVSQMTTNHSIMGGRNEQASNRQARRAAAVVTKQHIKSSKASRLWIDPPPNTTADNKCDTNADTCCLGKNFIVLNSTYRTADVYAYDTSRIQPIENVPIVTAATAFDDPETGDTFILIFNESLYYGEKLDHSLVNPNQIRAYEIPLWDNPYDPAQALSIEDHPSLTIPFRVFGTKVGFSTRVPTQHELRECEHIQLTSSNLWNPSYVVMVQATDQGGQTPWKRRCVSCLLSERSYEYLDPNSDESLLHEIDPSLLTSERLTKRQRISQIETTTYEQSDIPARRTVCLWCVVHRTPPSR